MRLGVPAHRRRVRAAAKPAGACASGGSGGVSAGLDEGAGAGGGGASEEIFKSWLDGLRSLATFSRPSHGAEALERGDL